MPRFVLSLLLVSVLNACSAGGPEFTAPAAPPDKAVIWLFRPSTVVGGGNTDHVGVNGTYVVALDIGEYYAHEVAPGPVSIEFRQTAPWGFVALRLLQELGDFEEVLSFQAKAGQNYYVEFSEADLVDAARAGSRIGAMSQATPVAK
ncbi:MAG: DUF2846 domain-containing protein [Pseudomonadota bacterium]